GADLARAAAVRLRVGDHRGDRGAAEPCRVGSPVLPERAAAAGRIGEVATQVVELSGVAVVTEVPHAVAVLPGHADAVEPAIGDAPEGIEDGAVRRHGAAAAGRGVAV